jgi:hypothetical protein
MNTHLKNATAIGMLLIAGTVSVPVPVKAAGAVDFLDRCIKMRSDFTEQRQAYFAKLDVTQNSVDTLAATPESSRRADHWRTQWRHPKGNRRCCPRFKSC